MKTDAQLKFYFKIYSIRQTEVKNGIPVSLLNDYLHLANIYSSSNSLFRPQLYTFYLTLRGELDLSLWNLADKKFSPGSGVEETRLLQHQSLKKKRKEKIP